MTVFSSATAHPGTAPATPGQEARLRRLTGAAPGGAAHGVHFHPAWILLRLRGQLNHDKLADAADAVVGTHDALRATFRRGDSHAFEMVVRDARRAALVTRRVRGRQPHSLDADVRTILATPFELFQGPLFRIVLFDMDTSEHVLAFVADHIVCDGWSLDVLVRDLAAAYSGRPLARPDLQFGDYANSLQTWLESEAAKQARLYWHSALGSEVVPELRLPSTGRYIPSNPRPGNYSLEVPPRLSEETKAAQRRLKVTLFILLYTALALAVRAQTGRASFGAVVPVANRPTKKLDRTVGWIANTVVIAVQFDDNPTLAALLERVRGQMLEALDHGAYPFYALLRELQPARVSELIAAPYVYIDTDIEGSMPTWPDLDVSPVAIADTPHHHALKLVGTDASSGLSLRFSYDRRYLSEARLHNLAREVVRALAALVRMSELRVDEAVRTLSRGRPRA